VTAPGAEEVARAVFAALARRDLAGVGAYLRPDDVQNFVPLGVRRGSPAVLDVFAELFAALPDLSMEVEDVVADENRACVRWRLRGTFTGGPFQGILATGRPIDLRGVDAMIEVADGLITANTIFYDGLAFARAVGVLPAQDSAATRWLIRFVNLRTRLGRLLASFSGRGRSARTVSPAAVPRAGRGPR
jgi:ketosteroid isomerase-like protein